MNPILRNILVFVGAAIVGMFVNYGIGTIGPNIIAPPEGVDPMDMESLKANIHLFQAKHYISPYLAHMGGALAGGYVVAKFAASHHYKLALGIGALFLIGGIMMIMALPSPMWFNTLDLVSYLPAAYLGAKLAR